MEISAGAGLARLGGLGLRFLAGLNQVALERRVSLRCGVKTLPVLQRPARLPALYALSCWHLVTWLGYSFSPS